MSMQRTLTIGAIVIVILGLGIAIYLIFFTGGAGVTVAPAGSVTLPGAGQGTPVERATSTTSAPMNIPTAISARVATSKK